VHEAKSGKEPRFPHGQKHGKKHGTKPKHGPKKKHGKHR
jgi:hypothetical protein